MRTTLLCLKLTMLVAGSLSMGSAAQTSGAYLQALLRDEPLYLKGGYRDDQLHFDSEGHLVGPAKVASFTLAGFDFDSLVLEQDRLILKGKRVFVTFNKGLPTRVRTNLGDDKQPKDETIEIEIQAPQSGDYSAPLFNVFSNGLAGLVPSLPPPWQAYGVKHFLPPKPVGVSPVPSAPDRVSQAVENRAVTPPVVLSAGEPEYNEEARHMKLNGSVRVSLQVSEEGLPENPAIVRPQGAGLDEQALAAVAQYRFTPATSNGVPTQTQITVDVDFRILQIDLEDLKKHH